jgi:hypothetical protein
MDVASSPVKSRRRLDESYSAAFLEHDPSITNLSASSAADLGGRATSSSLKDTNKSWFASHWQKWQRKFPILKKIQEWFLKVPPSIRKALFCIWLGWKVVLLLIFLIMLLQQPQQPLMQRPSLNLPASAMVLQKPHLVNNMYNTTANSDDATVRVLYIVTSLAEYNNGRRKTVEGSDRFLHQLLPVMIDSVESMVENPRLQVDVFLICAFSLRKEREDLIRYRLPRGVGLQVWDDALPLSYPPPDGKNKTDPTRLRPNTRALARQHRYVVRDKLLEYDLFVAFEDDMLVRGEHVYHYWKLSREIEKLRVMAPETVPGEAGDNVDDHRHTKFFGQMSKAQLERVVPGFVRVEAVVNHTERTARSNTHEMLEPDNDFGALGHREIDPSICCHLHMIPPSDEPFPEKPAVDDVVIWETNIKAFSLRQFPRGSTMLDWAVLMMGPGKKLRNAAKIGGYWSGREGAFGDEKRPSGGEPKLVAQQGGWMATQEQLIRMNNKLCLAEFLPPFDKIAGDNDGLDPHNVEFWSGSYQYYTGAGNHCNMQRIISMNPDHFSKHLLYHTANNKQKQLAQRRMLRANDLFGQLNKVRKMAEQSKQNILSAASPNNAKR